MSGFLVALDPGLDEIGWARLRIPTTPLLRLADLPSLLDGYGTERIPASTRRGNSGPDLPQRLARVGEVVGWLVQQTLAQGPIRRLVVERPERPGRYRRYANRDRSGEGQINAADLTTHHYAVGHVVGRLAQQLGELVVFVPSGRTPKPVRSAAVAQWFPALGRTSQDCRDALHLGKRELERYVLERQTAAVMQRRTG